jgi:exosortase D (VPLPA-CTERM-specific)
MNAYQVIKNRNLIYCLAVLVASSFAIGFLPIFQKITIRWSEGDNSYCYLVFPMFIYLCWEKKNHFKFDQFTLSLWGLVPACFSVFLIFAGELASVETLLYIGLWGCVTSVIIVLYGWKRSLTGLWFPLLVLFFIVPIPPFINRVLTFKMKMIASTFSVEMLRAVGVSVLQNGNVIDLGVTQLQVVDACSGLRYVVSMLLMALLIGHFFVNGWWRKLLLVALVSPLSIFINAVRIFVTGLAALQGYAFMTEGPLHDSAGIIAFLVAGAVLTFFASMSMRIGNPGEKEYWLDFGDAGGGGVKKMAAAVCVLCLLFGGSGWALQNTGSVLAIPDRQSFKSFPMEIGEWKGTQSDLSEEILDSLWADDYVNASFTREGSANMIYVLMPYYDYQGTRHTAHAPQSCLLGGGWAITSSGNQKIDVGSRDIDVGMMQLENGNMKMLASYFFLQRGRVIVSPWWNKFYLMLDAVKLRRTDGALVRVEMFMPSGQDTAEAELELKAFIQKLWPILGKYVPGRSA